MSFTDRKPFVVTAENVATYKRIKKSYQCALCGHHFREGDGARWIYANSTPGSVGNFFVDSPCDSGSDEELIQKSRGSYSLAVHLAKRWGIYGPDWERER